MNLEVPEIRRQIAAATRLVRAGDRDAAKVELRQLEGLSPRNDDEWRPVFAIFKRFNMTAQAEIITDRYIRAAGGSAEAFLQMALLHHVGRRKEEVRAALDAAMAFGMDTPRNWLDLARTLQTMQDYRGAVDAAERGLALAPDDFDLLVLKGTALLRSGSRHKARSIVVGLLARADFGVRHWLVVGELALKLDDTASAAAAARMAARTAAEAPDHHKLQVLEMLARTDLQEEFRAAFVAARPGNLDEIATAEKVFGAAIRVGAYDIARAVGAEILVRKPDDDYVIREMRVLPKSG